MTQSKILCAGLLLALAACGTPDPRHDADAPAPADNIPAAPAEETVFPAPDTLAPAAPREETGEAPPPPVRGGAAPAPAAPPAGGGVGPGQPAAGGATAPAADEGAAVLQRASTAYAGVRSLRADFVMNYTNTLLRQQTTSRGTLFQRRPDRIALRFTDPAGDVIVGDGEYFWVYYPSVDAQQVIRQPAGAGGEQGVDLQAQFVGDPVRRFQYTLHGQESVAGRPAHVLTLVPRERTDYRSLKVWLDARDSLARRFEIVEHNGTVRRFDLSNMEVNATIPDATFRFSPPQGARVVG